MTLPSAWIAALCGLLDPFGPLPGPRDTPEGFAEAARPFVSAASHLLPFDMNTHTVSAGADLGTIGMGGLVLEMTTYGTFQEADAEGRLLGTFSREDYRAGLLFAKTLGPLRVSGALVLQWVRLGSLASLAAPDLLLGASLDLPFGGRLYLALDHVWGLSGADSSGFVQALGDPGLRAGASLSLARLVGPLEGLPLTLHLLASLNTRQGWRGVSGSLEWAPAPARIQAGVEAEDGLWRPRAAAEWQAGDLRLGYGALWLSFGWHHAVTVTWELR